jgi:hypothetical protein
MAELAPPLPAVRRMKHGKKAMFRLTVRICSKIETRWVGSGVFDGLALACFSSKESLQTVLPL